MKKKVVGESLASAPAPKTNAGREKAPEPAAKTAKDTERPVCAEVAKLPDEFQKLTDRLLIDGSTFEEVVETVQERGGPPLTLAAVRVYFRQNLTLQMQRVRQQVHAAQALKAALGNPESAESDLAEAAFFTGYLCLGRTGPEPTLKDTERARLQRENLRLHQRVLRLKELREAKELEFLRARTSVELAKQRALKLKVIDLHRAVTQKNRDRKLSPETIQKIQEIYGLVQTKPPAPSGIENPNATA